jgi:hypothetical protein
VLSAFNSRQANPPVPVTVAEIAMIAAFRASAGRPKRYLRVPRYFFHMVRRDDRIDDVSGTEFPDLETATRHAVRIARELEMEAFGPDWLIVVAEENGRDLIKVTPDGEISHIPMTP